jgi:hypothetical protein
MTVLLYAAIFISTYTTYMKEKRIIGMNFLFRQITITCRRRCANFKLKRCTIPPRHLTNEEPVPRNKKPVSGGIILVDGYSETEAAVTTIRC